MSSPADASAPNVPEAAPAGSSEVVHSLRFAVYLLVGAVVFCILAAPAIFLNYCVNRFQSFADPEIIVGIRIAEYSIFFSDLFLFLVHLVRSFKRTLLGA
jgi:hypothetical protein